MRPPFSGFTSSNSPPRISLLTATEPLLLETWTAEIREAVARGDLRRSAVRVACKAPPAVEEEGEDIEAV